MTDLVRSDLFRYRGEVAWSQFFRTVLLVPGFRYSFFLRLCSYLRSKILLRPIYVPVFLYHRHLKFTYGISISPHTDIGPGFYIGHFGGIVVSKNTKIGRNCNISQGVTLGRKNRGKYVGEPVIGDQVYIGPGAKVIGGVHVGNNVAIGANCVIVDDVPDDAVVVGVPGRVISTRGSYGYVSRTWMNS